MKGTLYLCGTPIGNLEDITLRALRILRQVDLVAAEDTRHTLRLLNHFHITAPLISYHEHNKAKAGEKLVEKLLSGMDIALVTDAGMPGISDPGEELVKQCYAHGIPVTAAPGPTAFSTAVVLSGLSTRRFVFEGFLPSDKRERRQALARLATESRTVVLYEAPHRLVETLSVLSRALGDRRAAVVRELTKKFEEVRRASLQEQIAHFSEVEPKGEFAIVLEGISEDVIRAEEIEKWEAVPLSVHMQRYLEMGLEEKEAMKRVAKDRGVSKREIYACLKKNEEEESYGGQLI